MATGFQRADAPEDEADLQELNPAGGVGEAFDWAEAESTHRSRFPMMLAGLLGVLALGWLAAFVWPLIQNPPALRPEVLTPLVATACAPLILLALLWMIAGRTPRRETERFTRAVGDMRAESAALESILAVVAQRLEDNHVRLTSEASRLMSLGDEASDRLGRVTHYLARESGEIDKRAQALEAAAANARIDIGVLLHDLPRAEELARTVAVAMNEAGLAAYEKAGALETQLSVLASRGREADEVVGRAAQRLAAHLAKIESASVAASGRMGEAATAMSATVDETMNRAAEALDAARNSLEAQSDTMLALIAQSRAALHEAGADAGSTMAERLGEIEGRMTELGATLAQREVETRQLMERLAGDIDDLGSRLGEVGQAGEDHSTRLATGIETVRAGTEALFRELGGGQELTGALIGRAQELIAALSSVKQQLDGEIAVALAGVQSEAERTRAATSAIAPELKAAEEFAAATTARLADAEAGVARQRENLEAMFARIESGLSDAAQQLEELSARVVDTDETARRVVAESGPELLDALVRVREASVQAAERAREAFTAVIPQTAEALGEASKEAMSRAIAGPVEDQLALLNAAAERAVEASRLASERLTRQILSIGQSSAAIEKRIERERIEREQQESDNLARRVALLVESLNSTAIDVTKILSNEITDSAWSSYLKGDRGVFTRRAVRLLDTGEAREIVRHYEEEPEFREHVNRYIHDFESMLRRVLADRNGSALGVTLLSSDMGKLYVALAQAIERLRTS